MDFAYQTIIWGVRPRDFGSMFSSISKNGFHGVEIAQAPGYLPPPAQLRELLDAYALKLLSICGGKLEDRLAYCREGALEPKYYYVERLDTKTLAIAEEHNRQYECKCTLALHPHVYTELIQPDKTGEQLELHKDVLFLPDMAHLYMAHVSAAEAVTHYFDRLGSVHFKDWTAIYGRSCQRYARGFTQLGKGDVKPEEMLALLKQKGYLGWVVVECDYAKHCPEEHLAGARDWLQGQGIELPMNDAPTNPDGLPSGLPVWLLGSQDDGVDEPCLPGGATCFYRELFQYLRKDSLEDFGKSVLRTTSSLIPGTFLAQIWEYSPTNRLLGLLAEYPGSVIRQEHFILDADLCVYGETVETRRVIRIPPSALPPLNDIIFPDRLEQRVCKEIITVPVFNSCNPNQVQLVLSFCLEATDKKVSDVRLLDYAEIVAIAYETVLADLCLTTSCAIGQKLSGSSRFEDFLNRAAKEIRQLMKCDGVSIFLADTAGKRLRCEGSTGILWKVDHDKEFYERGDGSRTGKVWETNEPILLYGPRDEHYHKSEEVVSTQAEKLSLIFPMRDPGGRVIGVIRCRNRTEGRQMFAESDMALVEAICQTIVPSLLTLQESARRGRTINRMIHEIKVPLTAIRGATEVLTDEARNRGIKFTYDFLGDITSWLDLQEQQIRRVDFFRYKMAGRDELLKPARKRTLLLGDVVAPARRHIAPMLRERGFSAKQIIDDGFRNIPAIYIDRTMFQQVFFNLLGNSIKYCFRDTDSFNVQIRTGRDAHNYQIFFEDWGIGIPEGYENVIFEQYVRAPGAEEYDASGDGLGLWVVRGIVEAHGGHIKATHLHQPTQITIFLPTELASPDFRMDNEQKGAWK